MTESIEDLALESLAKSMAEQASEDPDEQILIAQGFRQLWDKKVSLKQEGDDYFYDKSASHGTLGTIWNLTALAEVMLKLEFQADMSCVLTRKDGTDLRLTPTVSTALHGFITGKRKMEGMPR